MKRSFKRAWRKVQQRILYTRALRNLRRPVFPVRFRLAVRFLYGAVILTVVLFTALTVYTVATLSFPASEPEEKVAPFPVSVDPSNKTIKEDPSLDNFLANSGRLRWQFPSLIPKGRFAQFLARLTNSSWYQMAIPGGRLLVIFPGERKEEVAKNFGDILGWSRDERAQFLALVTAEEPVLTEGKFYPERYLVGIGASPEEVSKLVNERFAGEVVDRYQSGAEDILPMADALIIASLLEREAYDFEDMREISGVIWNRLFINMPLQLDATLQYAKGSRPETSTWWPVPIPADKYINSPYNTYKNKGLPPTPISNPSLEAVVAALNPVNTDCLFYFHHDNEFFCSATYEEHVANLRRIYGQGR
ncbi:hypothetical protein A2837_02930 [Candidatus Kaiserbacteria bacterium RIFCSPHIGHO2_01_FULL_46_22]|uniref:Endolytic murein transglycosylase n=1 Tax=Candidatus Kaiserbacteria bacterium RIFCSPHIGHO2_01_FULL_46_22 TaxID=1798475 RepID=A0A1F6BWY1_9BACT|nr:MAG: hypothetical protein A2837_02930 [Candidatus Kaiserbacteria bacterium RIFCSPHIGHO2_01_FULL_46_22]